MHVANGLDVALLLAAWVVYKYVVVHLGGVAEERESARHIGRCD